MQLHLKLLAKALQSALDKINSGACDDVPIGFVNQATKSVEGFSKSVSGDDLLTLDQACEELGVGLTSLHTLLKSGDIGATEPLNDGQRVGIRRKHIIKYIQERQL